MPTSLMNAVPPGRTRASAVGTWVWVPRQAAARPSRCQPIATFSLVTSAWKSTITASASSVEPGELGVGLSERRARDPELDGPAQVEDGDALPGRLDDRCAAARVSGRVVGRPHHPVAAVEELIGLAVAVDVVAGGDHVDPRLEHLVGGLLRDPEATGRVLAVGDHEVGGVALAKLGHRRGKPGSAGTADDVADEQDAHGREQPRSRHAPHAPVRPPCGPHGPGSLRRQLIGGR